MLLVAAGIVLILGASSPKPTEVLIIQDELPQMQVLAGFLQEKGEGIIVYLMPGHAASDYHKNGISQMVLNAIRWAPRAAENR